MNAAREEIRLPKRECNRNMRFHKELNCVSANKDTMDVSSGGLVEVGVTQIRNILMALPEDVLHAGTWTKLPIK